MVVVAGSDTYHDLIGAALTLQPLLLDAGILARRAVGLDRFVNPLAPTEDTDVFVIYAAARSLDVPEQQALADRVATGKGVVALHSSVVYGSDGAEGSADHARAAMLGSRYISHGPDGVFARYKVEILGPHPITDGIENFEIEDEFYHIELIDPADVTVLAERWSSVGREPILYVRQHGKGRVCYLSLGHDLRAWANPGFHALLVRATWWAGGRL
jgi:uncharacterized protein